MNTLQQLDYSIFHYINHTISNSFLDVLLPFLRHAPNWIPLYIMLAIYLLYKYNIEALKYALYIVIAFALADFISASILKPWIGRMRPCHSLTLQARLVLGHCGGNWSFPSTHSSNHMAIGLSIVLANIFKSKWINAFWIIWALSIGFAQIYVGVHYPSDILAGFLLGIVIAYCSWKYIFPVIENMYERILIR